jgi:Big-like domain-containing protein
VAGAPVRLVAQNVSLSTPLPADGRIELAFDRYLLPASVTRQSFPLRDVQMHFQNPNVAYDPVARIVTITPTQALQADLSYVLTITSPSGPADPNGLRAIDGATIDPRDAVPIEFTVVATSDAGPSQPQPPAVDFCTQIRPILGACSYTPCHKTDPRVDANLPAAGLELDSPQAILATAVGRVAQGANSGPRATAQAAGRVFGVDMPIIDPGNGAGAGGNPGNSWLLYKLLLAVPPQGDGGTPYHLVAQPAFSDVLHDPARATLTDYVQGRPMPFSVAADSTGRTIDDLETLSRWIAQPLPLVPSTCP